MEKLKEFRKAKGMSMQELADVVGVCKETIYRYEHGIRNPDILVAFKIANALGVSIDALLGIK